MLRWILLIGLLTATACDTVREPTDVQPLERVLDSLPAQADSALTRHHIWHRWKTPQLAWHAQVLSGPIDPDTLLLASTDAFQVWADESSLAFQLVPDASAADLRIAVTDQLPCDEITCPVGVAWFPGHPERPGEILLRSSRLPTTRLALAEAVLHFAGHALGLEHVQDTWSAMSVMVRPEGRWGGLGHEDRLAIRGRYGRPDAFLRRSLYQPTTCGFRRVSVRGHRGRTRCILTQTATRCPTSSSDSFLVQIQRPVTPISTICRMQRPIGD